MGREIKNKKPFCCGLGPALEVISGKWKAGILWEIHSAGVIRFGELRRRLPDVSEKILSQQLREMEADGLIRREVFAEIPLRVEYSVTGIGAALDDALGPLADWGEKYAYGDARDAVDAGTAG